MATAVEVRLTQSWETPDTLWGRLSTVDHKIIGKRYLVTAMAFLVGGGIEALLPRLQLSRAQAGLLTPEEYNQIFTMHALTMILWYGRPSSPASPSVDGPSGFSHPLCQNTHRDGKFLGNEAPPTFDRNNPSHQGTRSREQQPSTAPKK